MESTAVQIRAERPLSGAARLALIAALLALNIAHTLFCLLALPFVAVLLLCDVALAVVMLRFPALALRMVGPMRRLFRLMQTLARSLRVKWGTPYSLPIAEADAPHLFATIRKCAELAGCPQPTEVVLQMDAGAYVKLEGVRSGRGKCTLGLGFDLLSTLQQAEVEAILLHEMAHARLVQRGVNRWTLAGVIRGHQLAGTLMELAEDERRASRKSEQDKGTPFYTARIMGWLAGRIARAESNLYALYSRQDEFLADKVAAEKGGAENFCAGLLKVVMADYKSAEVAWQDRMMQSQREGSYTAWVRSQLRPADASEAIHLAQKAYSDDRRDEYDTHPTIQDRFRAIGVEPQEFLKAQDNPALSGRFERAEWFRDEDTTAERLFAEIERRQTEDERENAQEMSAAGRKRRFRPLTGWERGGIAVITLGALVLCGAVVLFSSPGTDGLFAFLIGLLLVGGGAAMFLHGRPAPPAALPLPDFTLWEDSLERLWDRDEAARNAPFHLPHPAFGLPPGLKRDELLRFWTLRGHDALKQCDYLTAMACGHECLELRRDNANGLLLLGVSAMCLGQNAAGDPRLGAALRSFPKAASTLWGVGWACIADGEWTSAEYFLLNAADRMAAHPTLLGALALAQGRRGKTRLAIENWRRAVALAPDSFRLRLRLAQALLIAGKAREAAPEFARLLTFPEALTDEDVPLGRTRLHLMLGQKAEADALAAQVAASHPAPLTHYRIGASYFATDHFEDAARAFHRATATALFPAAWVQLGMIHAREKRTTEARACYLGAVNLTHPRAPQADRPLQVLDAALGGLRELRSPVYPLLPWDIRLNVEALPAFPFRILYFLTLAPDLPQALAYVSEIYTALLPNGPALQSLIVKSERAEIPAPDEATEPGIVDWQAGT